MSMRKKRLAQALIDVDPTMNGYHQTHIAAKLPQVNAMLRELMMIYQEVAPRSPAKARDVHLIGAIRCLRDILNEPQQEDTAA